MRSILLSFYIFIIFLLSCGPVKQAKTPTNDRFTLMVYMVGSDLESKYGAATDDIKEMQKIGSTKQMNVVITTGGSTKWNIKEINPNSVQRWQVTKGGLTKVGEIGKKSMGYADTLKDFIVWSVQNYPAEHYGLVLWDHGGGSVGGFGEDEVFKERLRLYDLDRAISESFAITNKRFEFIGFDACLMATLETAYLFAPYSKYFVGSEELEPGHGWDYTPILEAISEQPNIDGGELGKVIADGFNSQAKWNFTSSDITLSITDLSKINNVVESLEKFTNKANSDIDNQDSIRNVAFARSSSEDYGNSTGYSTDMVDLYDVAGNLKDKYPSESTDLQKALRSAVIYKVRGKAKPKSNGLSIYFPSKNRSRLKSNYSIYKRISFSKNYGAFVEKYGAKLEADNIPIKFESAPTLVSKNATDKEKIFEIKLNEKDALQVSEIYSILAAPGGKTKKFIMGMDDNVSLKGNIATYPWAGKLSTLGGNYVSMFLLNKIKDDDGKVIKRYAIPIRLNGDKMDLHVHYDVSSNQYEILGARRGAIEETGLAPKELIRFKEGDEVTPIFRFYDSATKQVGTIPGNPIKVGKEKLEIGFKDLVEDNYFIGFYSVDYSRNESYSDFYQLGK